MADGTNSVKRTLLSLSREEWSQIRASAPEIDEILRRECNIVGRQALFDSAGQPTPLLAVRLKSLRAQGARSVMDCLGGHLLHLLAAAAADGATGGEDGNTAADGDAHADDMTYDGQPGDEDAEAAAVDGALTWRPADAGGGALADGEACGGQSPGESTGTPTAAGTGVSGTDDGKAHGNDTADETGGGAVDGSADMAVEEDGGDGRHIPGETGGVPAGSRGGTPDREPEKGADPLEQAQELIAGLRGSQAPVLAAVARIRERVADGKSAADGDLTALLGWQDGLAAASALFGLDARDASLSSLDEAAAQAIAARHALSERARLSGMLDDIAAITAVGPRTALAGIVARASALSRDAREQTEIADGDKVLFLALNRVMTADTVTDVDPDDASAAVAAFGMGAFLAAIGALAPRAGVPAENVPSREWHEDAAIALAERESPAPELSFPLSWLIPAVPAEPEDFSAAAGAEQAEDASGQAEDALGEARHSETLPPGAGQPEIRPDMTEDLQVPQPDLDQDSAKGPESGEAGAGQVTAGQAAIGTEPAEAGETGSDWAEAAGAWQAEEQAEAWPAEEEAEPGRAAEAEAGERGIEQPDAAATAGAEAGPPDDAPVSPPVDRAGELTDGADDLAVDPAAAWPVGTTDDLPVGSADAPPLTPDGGPADGTPGQAPDGEREPGAVTAAHLMADLVPAGAPGDGPAAGTPGQAPDGEREIDAVTAADPVADLVPAGSPDPRIVEAVRAGHPGLAYWYSVALRLPAPVQDAFEVLALADAVAADGDEASARIREILGGFQVGAVAQDPAYLKVLAAGCARALLLMPFSPCADALLESYDQLPPGPDRDFLEAVWKAGTFGFDLTRLDDLQARSIDEYIAQRDDALKRLNDAAEAARHTTAKYPRATDVLRFMMNDKEPLGGAVTAVLGAPDELEPGEELLARLRDQKAVDRLINDTDTRLNPVAARRHKIVSGARDQIVARVTDILEALRLYLEAARALAGRRRGGNPNRQSLDAAVRELRTLAPAAPDGELPGDLGGCAVALVRRWTGDALAPGPQAPFIRQSPVDAELARAFEVTRAEDGSVDPASVTPEVLDACRTRSAQEAYEGFAARDNFAGIERLIEALRAAGDIDTAGRLTARQLDDVKISRERLRRLADQAERELALALFAALLSETESADLGAVLARRRNPDVEDFAAAGLELDDIVKRVAAARNRAIEEARAQLTLLDCPDEVRARITRQLDDGDLVTAQEFLAQLTAGSYRLPDEADTDKTFGEFWPRFIGETVALASHSDGADAGWLEKAAAQHRAITGLPLLSPDADQAVEHGLNGWLLLTQQKRGGAYERWLKDVLYLLGFEVRGPFAYSRQNRSGQWGTKFEAKLVGRALVPAYGSSADGHYQVLLAWGKQDPDRVIEMVEDLPRQAPVIVLLFSTLSAKDRRTLAERSRGKGMSAVVIDHAVMAFLATRRAARLQTTMSLALPFTAINPYTPFVLGDVPREVFYGRRDELRDVQDANGPLFVYGGRQLGKSTLLKTAMREFAETDEKWRSVYIDLKAEGIGELRVPDDLWSVLIPRLKQAGIIDQKVSAKAQPDHVVSAVREWLDADPDRRFLLLLDEADAFLEIDARPRRGQAGESRFVNVYRLKNLMDQSSRRFKPVFAGLHQVQRFHIVSNGPMAHVGAEILIGPLPPSEAYKLVVEPLAAIGYRFQRPDIAWRLLAYTNYQASLVQAFCNALVRRMHDRRLAQDAPPTVITDRDIDEVYSDREVRDWIASRFELTINLDNRYRVIAYTAALMTNDTGRPVFPVGALHDECKAFWGAGFQRLNLDDFTAYLDEMVGLGVLVRTTGDEYGIRSPNVIRLLGSPAEIERRLMESEDVLEVSTLFDPAVFRRKLGDDPDRRSPLTEQQVQLILEGSKQVHVITGSPALGLDRVTDALTVAAPEGTEVKAVTCATLNATVTSLSRTRSGRQHIVLDLAEASEAEQRSAVRQLHKFVSSIERRSASVLASPAAEWIWTDDGLGVPFKEVPLGVWTQDMLRAWAPECQYPLSTADQRQRLLDCTGGWPYLVEKAASEARRGLSDQRAREAALSLLDSGAQEFLTSVEIPGDPVTTDVLRALVDWSDEIGFDGIVTLVSAEPDAVLAAVTRLLGLGVLSNATSADSYRVNPLIARLLREP